MRTFAQILKDWEAIIGLEVHTQLTTLATKMFCDCRLDHNAPPNSCVCPVCLGLPGALPVPNKEAIRCTVMAGLACGCDIESRSLFYRKHYFYPDLPKSYQITQGPVAFCMRGHLNVEITGEGAAERLAVVPQAQRRAAERLANNVRMLEDGSYVTRVGIQRIHLEEDAAKLVHVGGAEGRIGGASESLVDFNRCGTPLMELVTQPDLRTPEEARQFVSTLRSIFVALGISDCSLESGSMRCDANVSVRRRGSTNLGVKSELKNLNSLRALHDALVFEVCRQVEVLEQGATVLQETRHWEPGRRRTVVMRTKETADDYRMCPDPDIAPIVLSPEFVDACRNQMPELPHAKCERFVADYGIGHTYAKRISGDLTVSRIFEAAVELAQVDANMVANVVINLVPACKAVSAAQVASLAALLSADDITFSQAREVLAAVDGTDVDPAHIVDERGMRQSEAVLATTVDEVLKCCVEQVRQYRDGNTKVIGFLVGQCVKASHGTGNPKAFMRLLHERLDVEA